MRAFANCFGESSVVLTFGMPRPGHGLTDPWLINDDEDALRFRSFITASEARDGLLPQADICTWRSGNCARITR